MPPTVEAFFHEPTNSLTYLVWDPASRQAAVIDPVLDYDHKGARTDTDFIEQVIRRIEAAGLTLAWLLETHVHADHLTAAPHLRARLGGQVVIGRGIVTVQKTFKPLFDAEDLAPDGRQFDRLVAEGDSLPLGELTIRVLETPGHTPDSLSYLIGDAVFVGDTFFMPDYGTARCDFPGGDAALLWRSLQRLLELPDATRLFVCHDYKAPGREDYAWETTVAAERDNVHLREHPGEAAFAAFRRERDATLALPGLILPAIQVNMRAGAFPPAAPDGQVYLRLPVDRL